MAGRNSKLEISRTTIAAARGGDEAARNELYSFVARSSFLSARRTRLPAVECEEISQEVSLAFRIDWDPERTMDSPRALRAFVRILTDRAIAAYCDQRAKHAVSRERLERARRILDSEPISQAEDSGSQDDTPSATAVGQPPIGSAVRRRRGRPSSHQDATIYAHDCVLARKEKQRWWGETLHQHLDKEAAVFWLARYKVSTIADFCAVFRVGNARWRSPSTLPTASCMRTLEFPVRH